MRLTIRLKERADILSFEETALVVTVDKIKVAYFPVPKAANTSMKHLLHSIKTGEGFTTIKDEATGAIRHIHKEYKTPKFSTINPDDYQKFFRIAIVRDPVDRVVSAWRNRVMHHKELEGENIAERMASLGLRKTPTLQEFVDRLSEYRNVSKSISIHTDPLTDFLGKDEKYYNLIFNISDSQQIEAFFSTLTGEQKKLPRKQMGGPPADRSELTGELIKKLEEIYGDDYRVFGKFLSNKTDIEKVIYLARKHKSSLGGFFGRLRFLLK